MTFKELCNRLRDVEETLLIEMLHIRSDDIVDRFPDMIELKRDSIEDELEIEDVFSDDELLDSDD